MHAAAAAPPTAPAAANEALEEDSVWCRRFTLGGASYAVEEEFGAGLGGTVWAGAVSLARHLRRGWR